MKRALIALLVLFAATTSKATNYAWNNTSGGNWFNPSNWSPAGVPTNVDAAIITNNGTYTVSILTNAATVYSLTLGGGSGTQTLVNGFNVALAVTNAGVVRANGVLSITNGGLSGNLDIQPGGTLSLAGNSVSLYLYNLSLLNQGTMLWTNGYLYDGGTPASVITNTGLWNIQCDSSVFWGSGIVTPRIVNQGTIRKSGTTGATTFNSQDFPTTGFIDVQTGTFDINTSTTNTLIGTVNVDPGATFDLEGGTYLDSGGTFTNSGIHEMTGGTLILATNPPPGLSLNSGTVILKPTFQQAGIITNLTLNGVTLVGTNTVGNGFLTLSNGEVMGALTIQPAGTLAVPGPSSVYLYSLNLLNQGNILWTGGYIYDGGTPSSVITNAALWSIQCDNSVFWGSGTATPPIVNQGTIRKSVTTGATDINSQDFPLTGFIDVQTGTLEINSSSTNTLIGTVNVDPGATFELAGGTYFDSGGTFTNSGIHEMTGGTLILATNPPPGLSLNSGTVMLKPTFQQAGIITNLTLNGATLVGTNVVGGFLTLSNGEVMGVLTIQPAGTLAIPGPSSVYLDSLNLLNQGNILWTGGYIYDGGTPSSVITNAALWSIQCDDSVFWGSGSVTPRIVNQGTIRKSVTTGATTFNSQDFPITGFIDVQTGTLGINSTSTNTLISTVNVDPGATFDLAGGTYFDDGGAFTNSGIHEMSGGTLILATNPPPGLSLNGGTVILKPTFQGAGAITNLTLNGATLTGTNVVGNGFLTLSNGEIMGALTIQPAGTLVIPGPNSIYLYSLNLLNQGTILWMGGYIYDGGAPTSFITNAATWDIQGDGSMYWGSGSVPPLLVNEGTLSKTAGTGSTALNGQDLINGPAGVIQVNTGTLQLPSAYTNTAGTLRVDGGTITSAGTLTVAGGTLDGIGTVGASLFTGGSLSPGLGGPGLITFNSGLNMEAGATLALSGTGTAQGAYDQLSVIGTVALSNATLQVTSLPSVPANTTFIIITNDGSDAVLGTFNGLPEGATLNVGGQAFQVHYAGGSGNDVTLVAGGGAAAPQLNFSGFTNGNWRLSGSGGASMPFTVQATTNFLSWTNVGTVTSDGSGHFNFIDTNTPHFHYRFYRTTN